MKTPNHPAMMYQDTVTAAALPGLCGHHGSDSSGQPNRLEIKLQDNQSETNVDGCDNGKGGNHQHRMELEPKNCGNRERQRNEANYEKHGRLARLRGDPELAE